MQSKRQTNFSQAFAKTPQEDLLRIFIDKCFLNENWRLKQRVVLRKLSKFWNKQCDLNVQCIPEIKSQQRFSKQKIQQNQDKLNSKNKQIVLKEVANQFPNLRCMNCQLHQIQFEDFSDFLKIKSLQKVYLGDWDLLLTEQRAENNWKNTLNEFRKRGIEFYIDDFWGNQQIETIQTGVQINFLVGKPSVFSWSKTIQLLRSYENFNFIECQVSSLFEELIEFKHRFKSLILPRFNGKFILRLLRNNPNLEKISIQQSQQICYSQFLLDDINSQEAEELLNQLKIRKLVRPLSLEFETQQIQNVPFATQLDISSLNIIQQEKLQLINGVEKINIMSGCSRRGAFSLLTSRKFQVTDILNEQIQSLQNLQELNIYRKKFWHSVDFSKLTQLTKLTISLEKFINSPELEVIQKLRNLKELELRSEIPGPCKIDKFGFLNGLKKLRCLKLYDVLIRAKKMSWRGLVTLQNLQGVIIEYSSLVDQDLERLKWSILKAFPEGGVYVKVDYVF